ncbi:hypothetical protein Nmel_014054 [Mimus melanotis]
MHIQGYLIYCATWAKVSHCQPFQVASAFKVFYPAYSLSSISHRGTGAEATSPVGATRLLSHLAQPPGQGCCYQTASPDMH